MDRATRMELNQRLKTAQRKTQEAYEQRSLAYELHEGTSLANAWAFMTAAYSGLEQSLKFLVAVENGWTIEELLEQRNNAEGRNRRRAYLTHDIGWLFEQLERETKDSLRGFYRTFQSLHDYIPYAHLDEFMPQVSGEGGDGYERWRYILIQPDAIPASSVEGLLGIWDAAVQVGQTQDRDNKTLATPAHQVLWRMDALLDLISINVGVELGRDGRGPVEAHEEVRRWFRESEGPLNALSGLVWRDYRGIPPEQTMDSDLLAEILRRFLGELRRCETDERNTHVRQFMNRVQGTSGRGKGIQWDAGARIFEPVPCDLERETCRDQPEGSYRITNGAYTTRVALLQLLFQRNFRVRENPTGDGEMPEEGWLCTVSADKWEADRGKCSVKIWEDRWRDEMFVELEGDDEDRAGSLRQLVERRSDRRL